MPITNDTVMPDMDAPESNSGLLDIPNEISNVTLADVASYIEENFSPPQVDRTEKDDAAAVSQEEMDENMDVTADGSEEMSTDEQEDAHIDSDDIDPQRNDASSDISDDVNSLHDNTDIESQTDGSEHHTPDVSADDTPSFADEKLPDEQQPNDAATPDNATVEYHDDGVDIGHSDISEINPDHLEYDMADTSYDSDSEALSDEHSAEANMDEVGTADTSEQVISEPDTKDESQEVDKEPNTVDIGEFAKLYEESADVPDVMNIEEFGSDDAYEAEPNDIDTDALDAGYHDFSSEESSESDPLEVADSDITDLNDTLRDAGNDVENDPDKISSVDIPEDVYDDMDGSSDWLD